MSLTLSVILKTSILLGLAGLLTLSLRRASASVRHAIWAIALLAAMTLPVATSVVPAMDLPLLPQSAAISDFGFRISGWGTRVHPVPQIPAAEVEVHNPRKSLVPPPAPAAPWPWHQWLALAWAGGAAIVFVRLILGGLAVRRLARSSPLVESEDWLAPAGEIQDRLGIFRKVSLRISTQSLAPMTWGFFRHVILLPAGAEDWSAERRRLVLAHELAHVKRNDGLIQVLVQVACGIYWFNPLAWYAARSLRVERECSCDDEVLKLGANPDDYADHLLQVARAISPAGSLAVATVAMAHRSQLETRLLSILDMRTERQSVSRRFAAALFLFALVVMPSLAAMRLTARAGGVAAPDSARTEPATVQGVVTQFGTNIPLEDVLVTFTPVANSSGEATEDLPPYNAETLSDGTFAVKDLPAGEYTMRLVRDLFVGVHSTAEPIHVRVIDGQRLDDIRLHMAPGPAISGRILEKDGGLKSAAQVELLRMESRNGEPLLFPLNHSMVTDERGEYRFFGLQTGDYYLRAKPRPGNPEFLPVYYPGVTDPDYAMPISVRAGADITGIDLSVSKGNQHSVRLKVEVAAPAPAQPQLSFYVNPRGRSVGALQGTGMHFHSLGGNTYVSPLLAPGSYEIEVYLRDPDPVRWARTMVDIDSEDVDAGVLVIGPGTSISGRVSATEPLPAGVRKDQLMVVLKPLDGSVFLLPSARVAEDGSFLIPRVPDRRFRIELAELPQEVYLSSARYGGREVRETGMVVSAASPAQLELFISGAGGAVAGVVRNAHDQPVANGQVVLIPAGGKVPPESYKTAMTDQFGIFSIAGIAAGEYSVVAWQGPARPADAASVLQGDVTSVIVQRGFTNTVNVQARP